MTVETKADSAGSTKDAVPIPAKNPSFAKRLLKAVPPLLLIGGLVAIFGRLGVLDKLETVALDTEFRLSVPPAESDVAIVNIDDDYYRSAFGSQSPLNPATLHDLIDKIAACHPKVIAVDIDTSDIHFKDGLKVEGSWPPVVWEREVLKIPDGEMEKPEPLPVLGGTGAQFDRDSGLVLLFYEGEQKTIRRYERFKQTTEGPLPAFSWAVLRRFAPEKAIALDQFAGPLLIKYAGDKDGSYRLEFTARKLSELYENQWKQHPNSNPIKDKIVLLGGSYAGEDRHFTPLGEMVGFRLQASVIETELAGGGDPPPNKLTIGLLEVFDGFLLILLFHLLRPRKALLISLMIIPVLALLCSFVSFGSLSRWAYFAPVLVGLLIYEVYEDYRRRKIPQVVDQIGGTVHPKR
jgi:CHASE2 domain-containing sensor protein